MISTFYIILVCTIFFIGWGIFEFLLHRKNLNSIPIRIHVNGTRGKSSVVRLIAAGLRQGGIRTFAKTTGSLPKMIIDDNIEFPIHRQVRANILEQLRVIAFAASNNAEALVIECMALQPFLQFMSEKKLIRSTCGVITNAREDHLDVMGPTEKDVALALLGTMPRKSRLFTCEKDYLHIFKQASSDCNSELIVVVDQEIEQVTEDELAGFSYYEHKENIALAVKVCEAHGVERSVAIKGMQKTKPDIGAMEDFHVDFFGRNLFFINGFAANDPESTKKIWKIALDKHKDIKTTIMIINTRLDRPDRSYHLGEAVPYWPRADKYLVIGSGCYFFIKYAIKNGLNPRMFVNLERVKVEGIFEEIVTFCTRNTLIVGIGNIAGPGLELLKYFKNRSSIG